MSQVDANRFFPKLSITFRRPFSRHLCPSAQTHIAVVPDANEGEEEDEGEHEAAEVREHVVVVLE